LNGEDVYEVRAKIQANMPKPETRKLADAPYFSFPRTTGGPTHATTIRAAIREQTILELLYADGQGQHSYRRVRPVAIWTLPAGWMFSAWCELRTDFRTFRLDRIAWLSATRERFAVDGTTGLQAFLRAESGKAGRLVLTLCSSLAGGNKG
jgi:predicted DNA-binding transcriptional regulator YafY